MHVKALRSLPLDWLIITASEGGEGGGAEPRSVLWTELALERVRTSTSLASCLCGAHGKGEGPRKPAGDQRLELGLLCGKPLHRPGKYDMFILFIYFNHFRPAIHRSKFSQFSRYWMNFDPLVVQNLPIDFCPTGLLDQHHGLNPATLICAF